MLHIAYGGVRAQVLRYHCRGAHLNHGADWCISFGGLRVDQALANEVLQAIGGDAVEAALAAAKQLREKQQEQRRAVELEAEQARYEARLAERRYQAVDPDNRLVAAELEIALERRLAQNGGTRHEAESVRSRHRGQTAARQGSPAELGGKTCRQSGTHPPQTCA